MEDSQGEVYGAGLRPLVPLLTHLSHSQLTLGASTLLTNTLKAVRRWFGAELHKSGAWNFSQSVSSAGAHRLLCSPRTPIPLMSLQPRFEPGPDPPAAGGHLRAAGVTQGRELPGGGQHPPNRGHSLGKSKKSFSCRKRSLRGTGGETWASYVK